MGKSIAIFLFAAELYTFIFPALSPAERFFYISSSDGYNSSDSLGTKLKPWKYCPGMKSWNKKIKYIHQPGDVFILRGGDVWQEGIDIKFSGNSENPDTYMSDKKWSAPDWRKPVLSLNPSQNGIIISDKSHLKINGIQITGPKNSIVCRFESHNISINDLDIVKPEFGVRIESGSHDVLLENLKISSSTKDGIVIRSSIPSKDVFNIRISNTKIKNPVAIRKTSFAGIRVVYGANGNADATVHHVLIDSCEIENSGGNGMRFRPIDWGDMGDMAYGIKISNNKIMGTAYVAIAVSGMIDKDINEIFGNFVTKAGYFNNSPSGLENINAVRVAGAYGVANPILRIYKNEISNTYSRKGDGNGLILDWRWEGKGPEAGPATQARNVWVYQNICHNNRAAEVPNAAGISVYHSGNNKIFYNLCYENNVGIKLGGYSADDNVVFNNSCVNNRFSALKVHGKYGDGKGEDLRASNNIFAGSYYGVWINKDVKQSPVLKRNCIFGTKKHLMTTQRLTTDSIFEAPMLSDDFQLLPGSPLIGAGIIIEHQLSDLKNRPIRIPPSIGAIEYYH